MVANSGHSGLGHEDRVHSIYLSNDDYEPIIESRSVLTIEGVQSVQRFFPEEM